MIFASYFSDFSLFSENIDYKKFSKKSILITGATGLIGSAVVAFFLFLRIKKNIDVKIIATSRSLDKLKEKFKGYEHHITLLEYNVINEYTHPVKPDFIVHAASNATPDLYTSKPIETIITNITGTTNVLNLAKESNSNLVYASTVEVYGNISDSFPGKMVTETMFGGLDCNELRSSYPESKRLSETLCRAYHSQHNVNVKTARLSKTYGPVKSNADNRVMAYILNCMLNNKTIEMKSDGSRIFSFCYITDAIHALILILMKGLPGEAYNIADSSSVASLKEVSDYCSKISGVSVTYEPASSPGQISHDTLACSSKLEKLGWKACTNILAGLEKQYSAARNVL